MDSFSTFAMGMANRDKEPMVFDWHRAAEMIREHRPKIASAGLSGDWEWTGGDIYRDGLPIYDSYTYLMSTWATPEIELDGVRMDCYVMQSEAPEWDSDTKWPESARERLGVSTS